LVKNTLTLTSAYLLVSHGSRDPRPQIALERLSYLVGQQLQLGTVQPINKDKNVRCAVLSPRIPTMVETASLELSEVSLSQKIPKFAAFVQDAGIKNLKIVPLFLLPGVHVREDIPREIAIAQQEIGDSISLQLCPYLGSYQGLIKILSRQFSIYPQDARIIISHGSRRQGGNASVEAIATQLQATVAYWSIAPSLSAQVCALVKQGKTQITIVPYFLFAGGITTIIAQQVQELQESFPQTKLNLGQPLGATPQLAQLMVKEITQ
jgi:sirohydrochlorin cobaltochelatase